MHQVYWRLGAGGGRSQITRRMSRILNQSLGRRPRACSQGGSVINVEGSCRKERGLTTNRRRDTAGGTDVKLRPMKRFHQLVTGNVPFIAQLSSSVSSARRPKTHCHARLELPRGSGGSTPDPSVVVMTHLHSSSLLILQP